VVGASGRSVPRLNVLAVLAAKPEVRSLEFRKSENTPLPTSDLSFRRQTHPDLPLGRRQPSYASLCGPGQSLHACSGDGSNGAPLALFDLILRTVSELPAPAGGHVLITSGRRVAHLRSRVDRPLRGPALPASPTSDPVERGSRHGVYVPGGYLRQFATQRIVSRLRIFCRNPPRPRRAPAGAVDPFGHVVRGHGTASASIPTTCDGCSKSRGAVAVGQRPARRDCRWRLPGDGHHTKCLPWLLRRASTRRASSTVRDIARRDAAHACRMRAFYRGTPRRAVPSHMCRTVNFSTSQQSRVACRFFRPFAHGAGVSLSSQRQRRGDRGFGFRGRRDGGPAFIFKLVIACSLKNRRASLSTVHRGTSDLRLPVPIACCIELAGENILTGCRPSLRGCASGR
jgi:hypothetical protein